MHLHFIRTKDGEAVDFSLSLEGELSTLVECKLADVSPHLALMRFAEQFPHAEAVQIVWETKQVQVQGVVTIRPAGEWLVGLEV